MVTSWASLPVRLGGRAALPRTSSTTAPLELPEPTGTRGPCADVRGGRVRRRADRANAADVRRGTDARADVAATAEPVSAGAIASGGAADVGASRALGVQRRGHAQRRTPADQRGIRGRRAERC